MSDEIIRDVWRAKDAIAAAHGHDVKRLAAHLRQRQKEDASVVVVDRSDRNTRRIKEG
jgi:hypothetical protein